MKFLIILCMFALISVSLAGTTGHSRGCIYIMGRCSRECEEGTHAYTTGCGYLKREPTCEEPNPVEDRRGKICDYSACYCDSPTVRDTVSGKCVPVEQCPKKDEASS